MAFSRQIILRQAQIQDAAALQQLFVSTVFEICRREHEQNQTLLWLSSIQSKADWIQAIQNQYVLLATLGLRLLGFGVLEKDGWFSFLYVDFKHQKKGIGQALYHAIEVQAKALKLPRIWAYTNASSLPFFQAQGFQILKNNEPRIQGVIATNFLVEKRFDSV